MFVGGDALGYWLVADAAAWCVRSYVRDYLLASDKSYLDSFIDVQVRFVRHNAL